MHGTTGTNGPLRALLMVLSRLGAVQQPIECQGLHIEVVVLHPDHNIASYVEQADLVGELDSAEIAAICRNDLVGRGTIGGSAEAIGRKPNAPVLITKLWRQDLSFGHGLGDPDPEAVAHRIRGHRLLGTARGQQGDESRK